MSVVADRALRVFEASAREKGVSLRLVAEPALPEAVLGDEHRLEQVLLNLVANAVKFTEEGDVWLEVSAVEEGPASVRCRFAVRDTGIGIPPEKQRSIFSPFEQADGSTTRRFGGTGLGLAIARNLVEVMGGELRLDSVPGSGSTFYFELDLTLCAPDVLAAEAESEPALPERRSETVLLVEDNEVNRLVAEKMLEGAGFVVVTAENGRQALELFRRGRFSAVLMDVQMPVMGGMEATRLIREQEIQSGEHVPIIALTAHALQGDRERCLEAGMDGYLAKPIEPEVLVGTVARLIDGAPAARRPVASAFTDAARDYEAALRRCGGNEALLTRILKVFGEQQTRLVDKARAALDRGDYDGLRYAAHTLKGGSGNVGAVGVYGAAHTLEAAAQRQDLQGCALGFAALERELERFVSASSHDGQGEPAVGRETSGAAVGGQR